MTRVAAAQLSAWKSQLPAVIHWPVVVVKSRLQRVRTLVLISGRPRSTPRPICSTVEHGAPGGVVALVRPATYWVSIWPYTAGLAHRRFGETRAVGPHHRLGAVPHL